MHARTDTLISRYPPIIGLIARHVARVELIAHPVLRPYPILDRKFAREFVRVSANGSTDRRIKRCFPKTFRSHLLRVYLNDVCDKQIFMIRRLPLGITIHHKSHNLRLLFKLDLVNSFLRHFILKKNERKHYITFREFFVNNKLYTYFP